MLVIYYYHYYTFFSGLGRINEANQYLSQAQWSVLKAAGEVDPLIKSNLHRNLGQLAIAKNNLDEAKRQFAEDVSLCVLWVGLLVVCGLMCM